MPSQCFVGLSSEEAFKEVARLTRGAEEAHNPDSKYNKIIPQLSALNAYNFDLF